MRTCCPPNLPNLLLPASGKQAGAAFAGSGTNRRREGRVRLHNGVRGARAADLPEHREGVLLHLGIGRGEQREHGGKTRRVAEVFEHGEPFEEHRAGCLRTGNIGVHPFPRGGAPGPECEPGADRVSGRI